MNIQEIYCRACFEPNPLEYLKKLRAEHRDMQTQANLDFVENNTVISNKCSHCGDSIVQSGDKTHTKAFTYGAGYWTPNLWRPYHNACKPIATKQETLACQKIDADCNDCKFFVREKEVCKGSYVGKCNFFGGETTAHVNTFTGKGCFIHRREE